jgi:hypothetical protein
VQTVGQICFDNCAQLPISKEAPKWPSVNETKRQIEAEKSTLGV